MANDEGAPHQGHIVGIGAVLMDHIALLPNFPQVDTKVELLAHSPVEPSLGGPVPVKLAYLAGMGWETYFIGATGDDNEGRAIQRTLTEFQVGTGGVLSQSGRRSAFTHVWINTQTGSRTIAYSAGTLLPLSPQDVPLDRLFVGASALICDAREPAITDHAARMARKAAIPVIIDTGNYREHTPDLLTSVDVVQAPARFVYRMAGITDILAAAEYLARSGPTIAIVTNGRDGCAYSTSEGSGIVPAFSVNTVDSLGAGDIFGAALTHKFLRGTAFDKAVQFASAAAALKCTKFGKENLATEDEIEQFIAAQLTKGAFRSEPTSFSSSLN